MYCINNYCITVVFFCLWKTTFMTIHFLWTKQNDLTKVLPYQQVRTNLLITTHLGSFSRVLQPTASLQNWPISFQELDLWWYLTDKQLLTYLWQWLLLMLMKHGSHQLTTIFLSITLSWMIILHIKNSNHLNWFLELTFGMMTKERKLPKQMFLHLSTLIWFWHVVTSIFMMMLCFQQNMASVIL